MLIVLSGPSTVGKSYTLEHLTRNYGFRTATPYTTRAPRISESEGFHYHFRSVIELRELSSDFTRGFWARPLADDHVYGYTEPVLKLGSDAGNWVIQAHTSIAIELKRRDPSIITIFLDFADDAAMTARIRERFGHDQSSLAQRNAHAVSERAVAGRFDEVLRSNDPEALAARVASAALKHVFRTPDPLPSRPGLLSDVDLTASYGKPHGIAIDGVSSEQFAARVHSCSIDLQLSPRYYRVKSTMLFDRVFDLSHGDAQDVAKRFVESVGSQAQGILLKPNEFILATTIEKLFVPRSLACFIGGRSSYARLGLSVEFSQVLVQPGHHGVIPLQIKNNLPYPIVIYPYTSIAQAFFVRFAAPPANIYPAAASAKYVPPSDDARSKYFVDVVYEEIRRVKPERPRFDWDFALNFTLMLSAWLTALAWVINSFASGTLQRAAEHVAVLSFCLLTASGAVRLLRLLKSRT
jgi:deoxycytidine triphosphate deaminase